MLLSLENEQGLIDLIPLAYLMLSFSRMGTYSQIQASFALYSNLVGIYGQNLQNMYNRVV